MAEIDAETEERPATAATGNSGLENQIAELERELRRFNVTPPDSSEWVDLLLQYVDSKYVLAVCADPHSIDDPKWVVLNAASEFIPDFVDQATRSQLEGIVADHLQALEQGVDLCTTKAVGREPHPVSDPIIGFSGQLDYRVIDFSLKGAGIDFVFERSYRSGVFYKGPLGFAWSHSYDSWLRVENQRLYRFGGTLKEDAYTRHPRFGEAGFNYWMPPDGESGVILEEGEAFVYRTPDSVRYVYLLDAVLDFVYRVRRIEDRHGNYLDFFYEGNRLRVQVNSPHRYVDLHYDDSKRITTIIDHCGRQWRYIYDDFGDLSAVVTPGTREYPEGVTTSYEYTSSSVTSELAHNLTRIVDGNGEAYLENQYGDAPGLLSFNRVIKQRQGRGETFFEYEDVVEEFTENYPDHLRPAHQTNVTEPNGHVVHYIFNRFGNLLLREEYVTENGLRRLLVSRYRYNQDGALTAYMTPDGSVTQYLYGREAYARSVVVEPGDPSFTENLNVEVRQGFGRLLAVVRRSGRLTLSAMNLARGVWGDIFPDVYAADRDDIVVKSTYEPLFGQLLTISDPRYTRSADPAHPETDDYQRTLTTYAYRAHSGQASAVLDRITKPAPTFPDGSLGTVRVQEFPAYDERGRLLQRRDASGLLTEYSYFSGPDSKEKEGYLQRMVGDPDGLALTTEYDVDRLGRVISTKLPKATAALPGRFIMTTQYNELDQITRLTTAPPFSYATRRFYDRTGNLVREEQDARDENGAALPDGPQVRTYRFDENFNLVEEAFGGVDATKHIVTKHICDASNDRVRTIDRRGNSTRFTYDQRRLLTATTAGVDGPDAATSRTEYNGDGRPVRSIDPLGHATSFEYDAFGRLIAIIDPLGNIVRRTYDKLGNITIERIFERKPDATYVLLSRVQRAYDELGQLISSSVDRFSEPIIANNPTTDFETALVGDVIVTQYFRDAPGRTLTVLDPLLGAYRTEYDLLGRVRAEIDQVGGRIENHYDEHGALVRRDRRDQVRDPGTGTITGEHVFSSTFQYDDLDRLIATTDAFGNILQYSYDSLGRRVRSIDALRNIKRARYDIYGRLTEEIFEQTDTGIGDGSLLEAAQVQYRYDANSNIVGIRDPLGRITQQSFDTLNRRRKISYPDATTVSFEYDRAGNLTRSEDANGLVQILTYDGLGRLLRVDVDRSELDPTAKIEGATFLTFSYDALGRRVSEENDFAHCATKFNSLGWALSESFTYRIPGTPSLGPLTLAREFDAKGAVSSLVYPGGRTLRYYRDVFGVIVRIENVTKGLGYPGAATTPEQFNLATFQQVGNRRTQALLGNGTRATYGHDGVGRVIEIDHASPVGTLLKLQYVYDGGGNIRVRHEFANGIWTTETFGYDSLYRLTKVSTPALLANGFAVQNFAPANTPPAVPLLYRQGDMNALIGSLQLSSSPSTFEYDLVGNRAVASGYVTNELDQYIANGTIAFTYDANGNMQTDGSRRYCYDASNRLVRALDAATGSTILHFFRDARLTIMAFGSKKSMIVIRI